MQIALKGFYRTEPYITYGLELYNTRIHTSSMEVNNTDTYQRHLTAKPSRWCYVEFLKVVLKPLNCSSQARLI